MPRNEVVGVGSSFSVDVSPQALTATGSRGIQSHVKATDANIIIIGPDPLPPGSLNPDAADCGPSGI